MAETFQQEMCLPVPVEAAFRWHERPGAIDRLIPPWEQVKIVRRSHGIFDGCFVELAQKLGPLKLRWLSRHHNYQPNQSFSDTQVAGPFSKWEHHHLFKATGSGKSVLTDRIEYQISKMRLGNWLAGSYIRRKLNAMFAYRHTTTKQDLKTHAQYEKQRTLDIAVTGASGLLGSTLVPLLTTGGHRITKLVRREPQHAEVEWDPQATKFDASVLDGVDAVVHLAGENVATRRWTPRVKEEILRSRIQGTRILCEGLARMSSPPKVLVCASATGFYGTQGDRLLTEDAPVGKGFLSEVAQQWEEACDIAREAGIRVVNMRYGIILSPQAGALAKMLPPFKFGLGGRIGDGQQYWSWISIDDAAGAILHALMTDSISGAVNAVAPEPATNSQFTKTLGKVLGRPTVLPVPPLAARFALGEMANELLLASARVCPLRLLQTGYTFRQPTLETALRHLLGKT